MWSFCGGILANLSEREWSGTPGVCPVLWSLCGLVNVYPRCEPVLLSRDDIDFTGIGALFSTYEGLGDEKPDNVGWLNGQLVWIDYDMSGRCTRPVGYHQLVGDVVTLKED